jgi:hypothetical protein
LNKFNKKNYIRPLSKEYTDLDAAIFKKYLHMPKVYLRGIVRRYPKNLNEVPLVLHKLLEQCDSYIWKGVKMERSKEEMIAAVKMKISGVPPAYLLRSELPSTCGTNLKVYSSILEAPESLSKLGRLLYFHSGFEDNSLLAASNIIKSGVTKGLKCKMTSMPQFMEELKTFEASKILTSLAEADISCLYMLGTVYVKAESGFTESSLLTFIDQRRVNKKATILSSHLTPAEFKTRFKIDLDKLGAICFKMEDDGVVNTVSQLAKELAALRGN